MYGSLFQLGISLRTTYNDTARIEIVIQSLVFAEKFRREQDIFTTSLLTDKFSIIHRNGGFDHHNGIGVAMHNGLYYRFNGRSVKEIVYRIIAGWSSNHNKNLNPDRLFLNQGLLVTLTPCQPDIFFGFLIDDKGLTAINHLDFLWNIIDRCYRMMLT